MIEFVANDAFQTEAVDVLEQDSWLDVEYFRKTEVSAIRLEGQKPFNNFFLVPTLLIPFGIYRIANAR